MLNAHGGFTNFCLIDNHKSFANQTNRPASFCIIFIELNMNAEQKKRRTHDVRFDSSNTLNTLTGASHRLLRIDASMPSQHSQCHGNRMDVSYTTYEHRALRTTLSFGNKFSKWIPNTQTPTFGSIKYIDSKFNKCQVWIWDDDDDDERLGAIYEWESDASNEYAKAKH